MVDEATLNEAEGKFDDPVDLENADFGDATEDEAVEAVEADEADEATEVEPLATADEVDEVDEADEADEADDTPVARKREPMLPKHRYDSVRRRLREAEAALEAERAAKAEAGETETVSAPEARDFEGEIEALNEQFTQALLDADAKGAATLNRQMMALQAEKVQALIDRSRNDVISESRDSVLTDTLVDELVASDARLNPDSDKFDQPLVTRLNSMRRYYQGAEGLSESQALVKSIEVLMPDAFESDKVPAPDGGKKLADKIAKANRQPPNANRIGDDGPAFGQGAELDPMKLTLEDLDKVTDAQWDQMLGNNL